MDTQSVLISGAVIITVLAFFIWSWIREEDKNATIKMDVKTLQAQVEAEKMSDSQLDSAIRSELRDTAPKK